jgi:hypothetical protein
VDAGGVASWLSYLVNARKGIFRKFQCKGEQDMKRVEYLRMQVLKVYSAMCILRACFTYPSKLLYLIESSRDDRRVVVLKVTVELYQADLSLERVHTQITYWGYCRSLHGP